MSLHIKNQIIKKKLKINIYISNKIIIIIVIIIIIMIKTIIIT